MLFKQLPVGSFSSSFFFFFFQFLHLDQSNPPENVKAQITKNNETLSSVSETAQALLTRLLVSSAIYLIRHD